MDEFTFFFVAFPSIHQSIHGYKKVNSRLSMQNAVKRIISQNCSKLFKDQCRSATFDMLPCRLLPPKVHPIAPQSNHENTLSSDATQMSLIHMPWQTILMTTTTTTRSLTDPTVMKCLKPLSTDFANQGGRRPSPAVLQAPFIPFSSWRWKSISPPPSSHSPCQFFSPSSPFSLSPTTTTTTTAYCRCSFTGSG